MSKAEELLELIDSNIVKKMQKQVKTKGWAKKHISKFHNILTTAGDARGLSKERSPEDVVAGVPRKTTDKGRANFKAKLKGVLSVDHGVNIADQIVDGLKDGDLIKVINSLLKELNIKGFES